MERFNWNKHINIWTEVATKPSGNYASNLPLDKSLLVKLMENHISDEYFKKKIEIKSINFPRLENNLNKVTGLNILSGLHQLYKKDCLTVFRAIRFPTPRRIIKMVEERGISMLNYEHDRLLKIYKDPQYIKKREDLITDPLFAFIPQERIVPGLPVFFNVNDAVHIHRAYRNENDLIGISVAFIPYDLIKTDRVEIFSNYALVQNYSDSEGDKKITYFKKLNHNGQYIPFYNALNWEGNLVYEAYSRGIPENINDSISMGIEQRFFLMDIYKPEIDVKKKSINGYDLSNELIDNNLYFLYGFWGDDNIFMRRPSEYLPKTCYEVNLKRDE